jgi:hypothetical protein
MVLLLLSLSLGIGLIFCLIKALVYTPCVKLERVVRQIENSNCATQIIAIMSIVTLVPVWMYCFGVEIIDTFIPVFINFFKEKQFPVFYCLFTRREL